MIANIDIQLYQFFNQTIAHEWLDVVMVKFSDKYFWIPFYCVVIFMLTREFKKKSLIIVLCLVAAAGVSDRFTSGVIKPFFARERPCHVEALNPRIVAGINCSDSGSMPSSHAANHFAVAVFFIFLYGFKKYRNTFFWLIWALLIGISRIYNGVHYPSDVLVGALIGALIGWLFFVIHKKILVKLKW
ncbi:MAG: phosphatase PAP2 family protein [Bacteroidota bacterium]|nr:phosphatase PAP2 family protein [Bacteroidota bacterium]